VYEALLTLLVSRKLLDLVSEHATDESVFPSERRGGDLLVACPSHPPRAELALRLLTAAIDRPDAEDGQKIYQDRPIL
jgi:putative transposase